MSVLSPLLCALAIMSLGRPVPVPSTSCEAAEVARSGSVEALRDAVEQRGLSLTCHDASGDTPLLVAVRAGRVEMVEALLALGAPADQPDATGRSTPLTRAAAPYDDPVTFTERLDLVDALLRGGANPNAHLDLSEAPPDLIRSPLAVGAGWSFAVTARLVAAGADPNAPFNGMRPLATAIAGAKFDVVRLLVCEGGADVTGPMAYWEGDPVRSLDYVLERNRRFTPDSRLYEDARRIERFIEEARRGVPRACD